MTRMKTMLWLNSNEKIVRNVLIYFGMCHLSPGRRHGTCSDTGWHHEVAVAGKLKILVWSAT